MISGLKPRVSTQSLGSTSESAIKSNQSTSLGSTMITPRRIWLLLAILAPTFAAGSSQDDSEREDSLPLEDGSADVVRKIRGNLRLFGVTYVVQGAPDTPNLGKSTS